jgi:hypothetical protein
MHDGKNIDPFRFHTKEQTERKPFYQAPAYPARNNRPRFRVFGDSPTGKKYFIEKAIAQPILSLFVITSGILHFFFRCP